MEIWGSKIQKANKNPTSSSGSWLILVLYLITIQSPRTSNENSKLLLQPCAPKKKERLLYFSLLKSTGSTLKGQRKGPMEVSMCEEKSQKLANWKKLLNIYKKILGCFSNCAGVEVSWSNSSWQRPRSICSKQCQKHWEAFKGMQSPLCQKVIWWVTLTTHATSQHSPEDFHNTPSLKIYLLDLSIYNPKLLHIQRSRKILKYFEKKLMKILPFEML